MHAETHAPPSMEAPVIPRTVRSATPLVCLLLALPARAEPPPVREATLKEQLGTLLGRPTGLRAGEMAQRAVFTSFHIQESRQQLVAAVAAVDQALVAYFPRLQSSARYARLSNIAAPLVGTLVVAPTELSGPLPEGSPLINAPFSFPVLLNQYVLQASLTLPLSDYLTRLRPGHAAAQAAAEAAKLNERAAVQKVKAEARVTYYVWVRARLQVLVAEQALAQSQGHLTDLRHLYSAGSVPQVNVLRVESEVAKAELFLERSRDLAVLLEDRVRTAMHEPSAPESRPYEIGEDVRDELPPLHWSSDFTALLLHAVDRRPELQALDRTAWALRKQVTVAQAGVWPKLEGFGELIYANPNPRYFPPQNEFKLTWSAGAQISWSPNDLGIGLAVGRATRARAAQVEAQRGALMDALRDEVMLAYQGHREAEMAVRTTDRGLAAAEESYRVRRALFQSGGTTSIELTDASMELTRCRLEALNALVDLRIARVRLLYAIGAEQDGL